MGDLRHVTYCGLYCGLCAQCNRIPRRAAALREAVQREGWDQWGREIPRFAALEARKATGFGYADIRCQPYEIPDR